MKTVGATYEVLPGAIPPRRAHVGDAGLDIAVQEDVSIEPHSTVYARAGVKFNVPDGYKLDVMTRSSTFKRDVVVVPTVVDQNYSDEISTIITNNTSRVVTVPKGTYLAQVVLTECFKFDNEPESTRSRDGGKFGSSDELPDNGR